MWGKIISFIATHFAWPLLRDAIAALYKKFKRLKSKKKSKQTADKARQKMEEAKTPQGVDNAADDTLSGI